MRDQVAVPDVSALLLDFGPSSLTGSRYQVSSLSDSLRLAKVATEFQAHRLEDDAALLAWCTDLLPGAAYRARDVSVVYVPSRPMEARLSLSR